MSEYDRRRRRGLLGARRRWSWSVDVAEEWLLGGFTALTAICTWATTPDDAGPLVLYSLLIFWAIALFVPYSVFAVVVLAIVEFLED